MTPGRRKEISNLADRVRDALKLVGPPYDVDEAVRRLGGQIRPANWQAEACVRKQGSAFVIELSGSASRERDRFSIAHELGHLFLHMGYLVDPAAWGRIDEYRDSPMFRHGHSEEELEAHEFAASFLMPAAHFKQIAKGHYVANGYDVSAIARTFGVSAPAARNRGRWLQLFSWD